MIGFLGKRRRGKDTACDYIVHKYGYTKMSFAYPLKKGVQEWFGFTNDQINTEKKEEIDKNWGVAPRKVFQVLGSDIVREIFPKLLFGHDKHDFWVKRANIWYNNNYSIHKGKVVWSDVRYQNEVDYILKSGGKIIKIIRPELDRDLNEFDSHSSETSVDNIKNYTSEIVNDGNLSSLYHKIEGVINL